MAAITVEKLTKLVDKALQDPTLAERIFKDPDAVARENGLSEDERLVVKQMNREQFETARRDADREAKKGQSDALSEKELGSVVGGAGALSLKTTTTKMIVGRAILGAQGTGFGGLRDDPKCDCCPWKKSTVTAGLQ
jgi:hypothetical protein